MSKPVILTFVRYYLPGFKSGGPVRTIANMVDHLGDEFNFRIVTSDRDALDAAPYQDVSVNAWNRVGKANVYYISPNHQSSRTLVKLLALTPHDVLYLNSFFDPIFTIGPLLARRLIGLPKRPVVIAPRGEFSPGALTLKKRKKQFYIAVAKLLRMTREVIWQASSIVEAEHIRKAMGNESRISVAPNVTKLMANEVLRSAKKQGVLRLIFLSRISPKKNLLFALTILRKVRSMVEFDIFGPVEDQPYWCACSKIMERMPANVRVTYRGAVSPEKIPELMAKYDLFFLPTLGENFGHVIFEALSAGCPVLISDQTPWRGLDDLGVGWDISLAKEEKFVRVLEMVAEMTSTEHAIHVRKALDYARRQAGLREVVAANLTLFQKAVSLRSA